jgi:hypothetical protein
MSENSEPSTGEKLPQSSVAQELEAIPYEPLLPVEKKLIAWCLALGVLLLGLLLWASTTFFPAAETATRR